MARHISECLPAWLIDEMAARGHDGARELDGDASGVMHTSPTQHGMCGVEMGGAPLWEEGENEAPMPVEVAPAIGIKGRGTNAPASGSSGRYGREGENTPGVKLDLGGHLKLVADNGWRGVTRPKGARPAPTPRRPMLVVVGGHARTGPK
jgi:hypothetical protein